MSKIIITALGTVFIKYLFEKFYNLTLFLPCYNGFLIEMYLDFFKVGMRII